MNKIKLLSKLQTFFDSDKASTEARVKGIETVLIKLKAKQDKTRKKLVQCANDDYKKVLSLEIEVMNAQIEKAENFLKDIIDDN